MTFPHPKSMFRRLLEALLSREAILELWLRMTRSIHAKRSLGSPFVKKRAESRFLILMYHRVNDEHHPFFPGTPIRDFEAEMEILSRHFSVLPLEELVLQARDGDLPANPLAVTFDDGYQDNYEHAFPILCKIGVPATIFLVTGVVETNGLIWHDRVFEMFRCTNESSFAYRGRNLSMRSPSEKKAAFDHSLRELRRCSPEERESRIDDLEHALNVRGRRNHTAHKLTWSQVKTMAKGPITFGAHTVTHPILSHMSADTAYREIVESKRAIEAQLGVPIRLFAYPNGAREDFDDATKELVAGAGFRCAVTTILGANDGTTDPYELRRVSTWGNQHHLSAARLALLRVT